MAYTNRCKGGTPLCLSQYRKNNWCVVSASYDVASKKFSTSLDQKHEERILESSPTTESTITEGVGGIHKRKADRGMNTKEKVPAFWKLWLMNIFQ